MDKKYWENVAPRHNDEIFDVFANDRKGIIRSQIRKLAVKSHTAMDMGCAVGRWLPVLSKNFRKVVAVDISENYLQLARQKNKSLKNVEYIRAEIGNALLPACDFILCINAVMAPPADKRHSFLTSVSECLRKKGHLVLVVPSLESALFAEAMLSYWHFKDETTKELYKGDDAAEKLHNLKSGIFDLDSVPTKHYLKEEIKAILPHYGLSVMESKKIEYSWTTEFTAPPEWLKSPKPWDWMFVARKTKS